MNDVKFALRQLWKNPGFAVLAIVTLALGIGSASAVFTLVQGVLLSPPPYSRPERLVLVKPARLDGHPYPWGCTVGDWLEWRKGKTFDTMALYSWGFDFLVLPDGSKSVEGMGVTRNYFDLLGLKPLLGRAFLDSDAPGPKSPPTAILLGYDLWRTQFNKDTNIIGSIVRLSRSKAPLTVIGVMPEGARFLPDPNNASEPNYDLNAHVDFWQLVTPNEADPKDGGWNAIARLRDEATVTQATVEAATITARRASDNPELKGLTAVASPLTDELNRDGRRLLLPLAGAVSLVFLIMCGNVTGLLLARGLRRQPEYAVRSALGAGRRRMIRLVLVESLLLAVAGSALGGLLSSSVVNTLKVIGGVAVPRLDAVTVGWPVLAFGTLCAIVAAALAGLLPALRAAHADPSQFLKGARSGAGRTERRLLGGLVMLQTALTFGLLAGATLLIRTTVNLAKVSPGFRADHILAMTVTTVQRDQWQAFHTEALARVSGLPGVKKAAFVWGLPLTGNKWGGEMEILGEPGATTLAEKINLPFRSVSPDYFDAIGATIIDGRSF
ncbi:MAG TPA: ABC transporter permease, partial [Verrucomicrobiae bacterium]|nr:ABC transporter permease [Verrucomicrobiae bacterium]